KFIVSSCDAPAMLDLVKEPLDAIACAIEVSTEVDGLSAIAFRGDVGPRSLLVDKCPGFRGNDTQAFDALEDEQCIRRARSSLRAQPICHHLYCPSCRPRVREWLLPAERRDFPRQCAWPARATIEMRQTRKRSRSRP